MDFDFSQLIENPQFQTGLGLAAAARPANQALASAYAMLQKRREDALMQEYRNAQIEQMREHSRLYGEQVKQQGVRNDLQRQIMGMIGADLGGAPQPAQPAQPQQQDPNLNYQPQQGFPQVQAAPLPPQQPQPPATGKHGTPTFILDNLEKAESSGNPFAVGPDIGGTRALGAYQFLPSTKKMLEQQGYPKFNVFDRNESRDAADYYLSKVLLPQNGGDWQKTLAAYGGFKSKDPTNYITKIMGTPEQQATKARSVLNQVQQGQPAQQLAQTITPDLQREYSLGPNGVSINLKPSYERARVGIEQQNSLVRQQEAQIARERENREAGAQQMGMAQKQSDALLHVQTYDETMDRIYQTARRLRDNPQLGWMTGRVGSAIPAQALPEGAMNALADLDQLKGQTFVQGTLSIRNASPTGAGVGNQSNQEGDKLQAAIAKLSRVQSTEAFKQALNEVMELSSKARTNVRGAYERGWNSKLDMPSVPQNSYNGLPPGARWVGNQKGTGKKVYALPDGSQIVEQ